MSRPDDPTGASPPSPPVAGTTSAEPAPSSESKSPINHPSNTHSSPVRETAHTTTPGGSLKVPLTVEVHSGTRTPRRVQWTPHIVSIPSTPVAPSSPSGTLDESNIDDVRAALERHQVKSGQRPRSLGRLGVAKSLGNEDRLGIDDDDYDYRLDTGPTGDETKGRASLDSTASITDDTNLQTILDNGMHDHVTAFINLGERDGLPKLKQPETRVELSEAADLVHAHSGKWGMLRRRINGAAAVSRAFAGNSTLIEPEKEARGLEAFASRYPEPDNHDRERHGRVDFGGMPTIPGGTSVLSSLLALYGQQNLPSGTSTAASSRPTSEDNSEDDENSVRHMPKEPAHDRRDLAVDVDREQRRLSAPAVVVTEHEGDPSEDHRHGSDVQPHSKSATSLVDRPSLGPSFKGFVKMAQDQIQSKERPKAARSGAGVFGALIQNTSNLSGAATPTASAVAPAAKRPGYQLSRYSMPNEMTSQRSQQPWRPQSRSGSRPGSVHSSTAVSHEGENSPKEELSFNKTVSSEEMLTAMSERKRPKHTTLDSLGKLSGRALKEGGQALKQTEKWILSGVRTPMTTPPEKVPNEYFNRPLTQDERKRREWEMEKKRRKKQKEMRKKQEIFASVKSSSAE
ncbi:MAG: hypothetical protein TREMPRED_000066 [Tremellales sp. Tagirdzhanova-0007]|nr:MAG: hypothetical protein TREMPRED_000066 [Tremellales sp. Tagirdzhanova-0007]